MRKNNKADKCAWEIIRWLQKHDNWIDVAIYVNGGRYLDHRSSPNTEKVEEQVYWEDNKLASDYFDGVPKKDFLSMSFEGPLYHIINLYDIAGDYSYSDKMEEEFSKILEKYGYYYEQYNSWNLSCFPID